MAPTRPYGRKSPSGPGAAYYPRGHPEGNKPGRARWPQRGHLRPHLFENLVVDLPAQAALPERSVDEDVAEVSGRFGVDAEALLRVVEEAATP